LPKPIIGLIVNYLEIEDKSRFSRTCKKYRPYSPDLNILRENYRQAAELVEHVFGDVEMCKICFYMDADLNECAGCGFYVCEGCLPLRSGKGCELCEDPEMCKFCAEWAVVVCRKCHASICAAHYTRHFPNIQYFLCPLCK
jgi:hypothetical protein